MENQLPELKVNMLGRFSITYGEQPITFKRNSATKAVKLLQILLHSSLVEDRGSTGIPRAQLLDDLFGREELANVGNNLRVTVFRLRKMLIERNGQSAFLMVCSLTDGNGHPMENREKLDVMSMELHRAVKNSLRRGDSFSKYSPSQFLILLVGTSQENCDIIFRRIAARFTQKHGSWNKYLEYYVSSIADVENPNARLSFQKNEFRWK